MIKIVHGKIRGNAIELTEELGLAEGQEVEVSVRTVPGTHSWGDGLRRCAGALSNEWTEADDRILAEIHHDRKGDSRREIPE